jgi:hypothetical protein
MKIVPTFKLKSMATIDSKIVQRGRIKGYWQDLFELTYCTKRRKNKGISIVYKKIEAISHAN